MIEFGCKNCGQKLSVQDQYSGKRVKCPKCGSVGVVPDNSDKIKFHCKNCGQSISVPQIHAGKKGKCPKCKNPVVVPSLKKEPTDGAGTFSVVCSMCNEAVQVPETSRGQTIECPECGSYIETSSESTPSASAESGASIPPRADEDLYEEGPEAYEESVSVDRHLIVVISAVAAVVVVGLIILAVVLPAVLRLFRPRPAERPEGLRGQQQVADTDSRPQPVTSDTQPTEPIVQELAKKDISPSKSVYLEGKLENTKIAFTSARYGNLEIYVMNADGSKQKNLTNNPADDRMPSWSPDGKKIAFASQRDGHSKIYVMNADGSEQKRLTDNSTNGEGFPSWSPDGKKIAFRARRGGPCNIYVMNFDGSEQKRLTNSPANKYGSSWSPDGKKIVFSSQRDEPRKIYVVNIDGGEPESLTNNPAGEDSPSWSPDGKKIAFESWRDGNSEIYVMNADGSEQKRLTTDKYPTMPMEDESPSWSPDGKKIVFSSERDGRHNIYVMNADGSEQKRLTSEGIGLDPSWSPFLASVAKEESQKEDTPPIESIVQEPPPKPSSLGSEPRVKLRQKFSPGKYGMIRTETNKQVATVEGRTVTKNQSLSKWFEVDASEPDVSGQTTCVVTMRRMRMSDSSGPSYDTDDPDSLRGNKVAQISSKIMLNRKFVLKFGQDGKLVTVSGVDRIWDGMIDEMAKEGPIAVQMILQFKQMGHEAFVKQNLGLVYDIMPDEPIGVGAVWHKVTSENTPFIGAAKISAEYELREIEQTPEGKIAHITCVGSIKQDESKRTQVGPMSITVKKWDLKQKGEIQLNVDTGLMISSRMEMDGEAEISMIARGRSVAVNSEISHTTETTTKPVIDNWESKGSAPEPIVQEPTRRIHPNTQRITNIPVRRQTMPASNVLFVYIIVGLIGLLIAAVVLRAAAQWVASIDVGFGDACATLFLAWLINLGVGLLLGLIVGPVMPFIASPIGFLVQTGVISWRLSVSFGKALLISLVMVAIWIGIFLIGLVVGRYTTALFVS